jgi:hypothetical protein
MRSCRPMLFLVGMAFISPGIVRALPPVSTSPSDNEVLDAIRSYGQGARADQPPAPSAGPARARRTTAAPTEDDSAYVHCIMMMLYNRNYGELEREAHEARVGKGRFAGGVWKLYDFYAAVSGSPLAGDYKENDFINLHQLLAAWGAADPKSATAQIALAEMYVNWGTYARGSGYADAFTDGWKIYKGRAEIAKGILVRASQLDEKCPFWYEAMQHVAMAQGWDKSQARYLLDQAVQFEPGFYHFYREYALFLEPRWYGEPGEAESFAKEISDRVGGEYGAYLYFEIASLLTCQCSPDPTDILNLSWPKIKEGYAAMDHLYGVSNVKLNRFAYMAYLSGDQHAARPTFRKIGEHWTAEPWLTREQFENAKAWAAHGNRKLKYGAAGTPKLSPETN